MSKGEAVSLSSPDGEAERSLGLGGLQATERHPAYCFEILTRHLGGEMVDHDSHREMAPSLFRTMDDHLHQCPMFVTWTICDRAMWARLGYVGQEQEYRLRGCVGTFEARSLWQGLGEFAIVAATKDSRFRPIERRDIPQLQCSTSFLHSFERQSTWDDWTIGTHGITIDYTHPGTMGNFHATFLPSVASEQGWDHRETVEHLLIKAGYHGEIDDDVLDDVRVTRYQSTSCSLTYHQWQDFRILNGIMEEWQ